MTVTLFEGSKRLPILRQEYYITLDGELLDDKDNVVSLGQFNTSTGLDVSDLSVLTAITYQKFHWPPSYWKHLRVLQSIEGVNAPESLVLAIDSPVESLDYPGFFLIPYFSGYLITPDGYLLKRPFNQQIKASESSLGYFTYRMTDDSGSTQNFGRHRILCFAFKPYPANVEDLDVNHIDGVPGHDSLSNLEWATRSENMMHAYATGLRVDNKPVEMREVNSGRTYIYPSCSSLARVLGVTECTISNRAKTRGFKSYGGLQFRFYPDADPWPPVAAEEGMYLVEFPDGSSKRCNCHEAARLAGLTRTSLLRALREGRNFGSTPNKVTRLQV